MKTAQDRFLNALRKTKTPVTIIVSNGYQIKNALIREFDSFVLVLEADGKQMLVFKHAVSTITPAETIDYADKEGDE